MRTISEILFEIAELVAIYSNVNESHNIKLTSKELHKTEGFLLYYKGNIFKRRLEGYTDVTHRVLFITLLAHIAESEGL